MSPGEQIVLYQFDWYDQDNSPNAWADVTVTPTRATTSVAIQTNPSGRQFSVDGGALQTAPQTLSLSQGSHTITVATTQAGGSGTQYVFTVWSDEGAASHTITVGDAAANYTASFKTQYQLTISASPPVGGTVTPASGGFYDAGTSVPISATAATGYSFTSWSGGVANAGSASTTVTMNTPQTVTAHFASSTPVTIQTSPPGRQFSVDGGAVQTAPQMLSLSQGSHTIAVAAAQSGGSGTRYVFTGWSDEGAASHTITVGATAATYTASFKTQYQLTISASPAAGGTVTPASGSFYDSGTSVQINAMAATGYSFISWSGAVANASSASTTIAMNAPQAVTANFASLTKVTVQTNPPGRQFSLDDGTMQIAPLLLSLSQGSHTITVATTQSGGSDTQYVFMGWSDGGSASHTITVGAAAVTYTASFKTQFLLTISASPIAGGTVTPATGSFYDSGTFVPISATAATGYSFNGWSGSVVNADSYSTTVAMNAPQTVTANFASATGVTIQTNPPGRQISVDGGPVKTAPQTLSLSQGSHTIAVATTQSMGNGTQYVFTSWSDGGAASHTITVGDAAANYTATFKTQYQLTISASPAVGGTVTPASGSFYDAGTSLPISATAATGYSFTSWSGTVANASSASTTVSMNVPQTVTANFASSTGVTIQTSPPGRQFSVDGGPAQTAPQTLNLSSGSHTIVVAITQGGGGTQYVFTGWSDGGAAAHTITVGATAANYTANFKTQYQLTISASPAAGGTVTPASGGYYDSGTAVPITATAATGYSFVNWNGGVANAGSPSTTVAMNVPQTVAANFATATTNLTVTPTTIFLAAGQMQQFTATVGGSSVPVTWSLSPNVGSISAAGLYTAPGVITSSQQITVTATRQGDSSKFGTATVSLKVPDPPGITLSVTAQPITITDQPAVTSNFSTPYPMDLTAQFELSFTSNAAGLPQNYFPVGTYPGAALQFASGGTTAKVTIAANSTSLSTPAIQIGDVAGTIIVTLTSLSVAASGQELPMSAARPFATIQVPRLTPLISSAQITSVTASGFTVEVVASSTPRDLVSATLNFVPTAGAQLTGTAFTIPLDTVATPWFATAPSQAAGGAFRLQIPFPLTGDIKAIDSVSVVLTNSVGSSTAMSGRVNSGQ